MKFSRLLKNIFYFSESKELRPQEYNLPKGIEDFFEINFSAFLDKNDKEAKKIKDFEEYALSDEVSIAQLTFAIDYEKSKTAADIQEYNRLSDLEDDLKEDFLLKKQNFPTQFYKTVINSKLINKEQRKNLEEILDSMSKYGAKDQQRELEFYEKKIQTEIERYRKLKKDIEENTIISDEQKRQQIQDIERREAQAIKNVEVDISKAGYIEQDSYDADLINMARNIISSIGKNLNQGSGIRRAILNGLILKKQQDNEIKRLLDAQNKHLKDLEEQKKKDNLQSIYGITKSKSLTISNKEIKKIEDKEIKPVYWKTISPSEVVEEWENTKKTILSWWENLKETLPSINTIDKNYHLLSDTNKIFYRLFNPKEDYFNNQDISEAAYTKILTKSPLALLPSSIIETIKENKSKNPKVVFDKINSVINRINGIGKELIPIEVTSSQKLLEKIKNIKIDPNQILISSKKSKTKEELEKEREEQEFYAQLRREQSEKEREEEKQLSALEEEEEESEKQQKELDDFIKRLSSIVSTRQNYDEMKKRVNNSKQLTAQEKQSQINKIESDKKTSTNNMILMTLQNLEKFIVKIKNSKSSLKFKNDSLDLIELAVSELDDEVIGTENVISAIESAREFIKEKYKKA